MPDASNLANPRLPLAAVSRAGGGSGFARLLLWLFIVASAIVDPLYGVFGKLVSIFLRIDLPARADSPARRRRGLTLIVGGIEGPSLYNRAMAVGVLRGRFRGSVVRLDWNDGIPILRSLINLMSPRHQERQSDRLAEAIRDYRSSHPDSPVCLLAQSGGCWIVVRALEKLPAEVRVRCAVLLAPSISRGYDLTMAAAKCSDGLFSVGGPADCFFLGLGTLVLGTSDRVFAPAAGWLGWRKHPTGFSDVHWHPSWIWHSYIGNHTSSSARRFIRRAVTPHFRTVVAD